MLGRHLYYLKRVLLWSAETQRSVITRESSQKTEMMRAQLERETVRKQVSQEEFLKTLGLRMSIGTVSGTQDLHMNRALELFNKTNQFNTRGTRYTLDECHRLFLAGRQLFVLWAEDRFTHYGLIGAAWVHENCIEHMVLSCRVLGLGVEETFLAHLAQRLSQENATTLLGQLVPTEANAACRDLYRRNGFSPVADNPTLWIRPLTVRLVPPPHVSFTAGDEAQVPLKSSPGSTAH